jgi:histidinol-phosphate aminotransferase
LVLDEAYADFARSPKPDYNALLASEKVAILRTFSKLYGLAGIRAAYGLAPPFLVDLLNNIRQPFNLNNLAQVGALAALEDKDHIERTLSNTWEGLDFLAKEFQNLGLLTFPTEANFIMVDTGDLSADEMTDELTSRGIIIRSLSSFGFNKKVRVSAGLFEENKFLITALSSILKARTA